MKAWCIVVAFQNNKWLLRSHAQIDVSCNHPHGFTDTNLPHPWWKKSQTSHCHISRSPPSGCTMSYDNYHVEQIHSRYQSMYQRFDDWYHLQGGLYLAAIMTDLETWSICRHGYNVRRFPKHALKQKLRPPNDCLLQMTFLIVIDWCQHLGHSCVMIFSCCKKVSHRCFHPYALIRDHHKIEFYTCPCTHDNHLVVYKCNDNGK